MKTPTMEDKERLVEALVRYGYTRVIPTSPIWHLSQHTPCETMKPYHIIIDYTEEGIPLTISHEGCGLYQSFTINHVHSENFLKEMIPVIGRLDACAYYEDDGITEYFKVDMPRLRIYL